MVEITNEDGEIIQQSFKTKQEIVEQYQVPLYMVNKIIKINNNNMIYKRKSHNVYADLVDKLKILLIKPKF